MYHKLTNQEKEELMARVGVGEKVSELARTFNVARSSIYFMINKHQTIGSVAHQPGAGRPKATTVAEDRLLINDVS